MCLICDRINMITNGTNPYFVKELETGYVVIGDNQHFMGIHYFCIKIMNRQSCFNCLCPNAKNF